jgi:hypothetical protein
MPSTFTPALELEKPADGEDDNTWGGIVRANYDKIDAGMAWVNVGSTVFVTPQPNVQFELPSTYSWFRLVWQSFSPTTPGGVYVRYSVDDGITFLADAGQYARQSMTQTGIAVGAVSDVNGALLLSPDTTSGATSGDFEFQSFGGKLGIARCLGTTSASNLFLTTTGSSCANASTATHIQIGFAFTSCASGRLKLFGSV